MIAVKDELELIMFYISEKSVRRCLMCFRILLMVCNVVVVLYFVNSIFEPIKLLSETEKNKQMSNELEHHFRLDIIILALAILIRLFTVYSLYKNTAKFIWMSLVWDIVIFTGTSVIGIYCIAFWIQFALSLITTIFGCYESGFPDIISPKENIEPKDEDAEKRFELTQMATSSSLFVSALETIPRLRKKCATLGIKSNFEYSQPVKESEMLEKPFGEYVVESILDHDIVSHLYLVKWKGYDNSFNTWEPIDHLQSDGTSNLVSKFRLMERSLSEDNRVAFKKLISLNCLVEELISPANQDPILLLKLNGKCASDYKPGHLFPLKRELKSNCTYFKNCINRDNFRLKYTRVLTKILKDLHVIEAFESFEKLQEFSMLRRDVFKGLKNWEAKINRIILREEGCAPIEVENNVDLDLPPNDFNYITKCRPGPNVDILNEPVWYCDCKNGCISKANTCCPSINKSKIIYNQHGCLKNQLQSTIFECNSKCECPSNCPNRVIQKGRQFKLGIFKSDNGRGWGVRALERIPKGRFVVEYVGEIVTSDEAERRSNLGLNPFHKTYLFDLEYEIGTDCDYVVDGAKFGNVSHFINHSCSPNLEVYMFWVDSPDVKMPRIAFFSQKSISKGEEITFDYRMSAPRTVEPNDGDESDVTLMKVPCKCMSPNCRKFLF